MLSKSTHLESSELNVISFCGVGILVANLVLFAKLTILIVRIRSMNGLNIFVNLTPDLSILAAILAPVLIPECKYVIGANLRM